MHLRFLICSALIFGSSVGLSRTLVRSQFLPGGLKALPSDAQDARAIFQDAIDCGIKGDVFFVSKMADNQQLFQTGVYFLVREMPNQVRCTTSQWTFLMDSQLRQAVAESLKQGNLLALYNPTPMTFEQTQFKIDAIAVPAGNKMIAKILDKRRVKENPVLVVTPSMTLPIFEHESQHFEDYRDQLPEKIRADAVRLNIGDDAVRILIKFLLESRAYGREHRLLANQRRGFDFIPGPNDTVVQTEGPRLRRTQREHILRLFETGYGAQIQDGLASNVGQNHESFLMVRDFILKYLRPSDIQSLKLFKSIPLLKAVACESALVSVVPVEPAPNVDL